MRLPDDKTVEALREKYPAGARVELLFMDDPQAPEVGTQGTVMGVDDAGSIMVNWDDGSGLSVAYGADRCRSLVPDFTGTIRAEILDVRKDGAVNMFDVNAVQRIAFDKEYFDLVLFLEGHLKEYANFILEGRV